MTSAFTANGNLVLTLTPDLAESLRETEAYYKREALIAEALHERYDFIQPVEIGALTEAPILCNADDTNIADNGDRTFVEGARIYWFPNYQVEDPWETLLRTGVVIFTAAPKGGQ